MSECWKCEGQLNGRGNYCGQCGAPQNAKSAAQSFHYDAKDFKRGLDGLLDLLDGCREMLAEGLADEERYDDISASEWLRRLEDPFDWLELFLFRLWLGHYGISVNEAKQFMDEHGYEIEAPETKDVEFPIPANETYACGASLPSNSPSIITRWKDSTESMAV